MYLFFYLSSCLSSIFFISSAAAFILGFIHGELFFFIELALLWKSPREIIMTLPAEASNAIGSTDLAPGRAAEEQ